MDVRMIQQKAGDARSIVGYTAQALSAYFGLALLVLLLLRVLVEMNEHSSMTEVPWGNTTKMTFRSCQKKRRSGVP